MKYSFPPILRLHTQETINNVFSHGGKISRHSVAVFFYPNNLGYARMAVIVPKKNIHSAVRRHCVKRIVRESFRQQRHSLDSLDNVVFVYASAKKLNKGELRLCVDKLWQDLIRTLPGRAQK